jgi:hypothetical protein
VPVEEKTAFPQRSSATLHNWRRVSPQRVHSGSEASSPRKAAARGAARGTPHEAISTVYPQAWLRSFPSENPIFPASRTKKSTGRCERARSRSCSVSLDRVRSDVVLRGPLRDRRAGSHRTRERGPFGRFVCKDRERAGKRARKRALIGELAFIAGAAQRGRRCRRRSTWTTLQAPLDEDDAAGAARRGRRERCEAGPLALAPRPHGRSVMTSGR